MALNELFQNNPELLQTPDQARQQHSLGAAISQPDTMGGFLGALIGQGLIGRGQRKQRQEEAGEQAEQVQNALQRAMAGAGFDRPDRSAMEAQSEFLLGAIRELNGINRPDLALKFAQQLTAAERDRANVRNALLEGDARERQIEESDATRQGRIMEQTAFGLQDPTTGEIKGPFILSDAKDLERFNETLSEARSEGRALMPETTSRLAQLSTQERLAMMQLDRQRREPTIQGRSVPFNNFYHQSQGTLGILSSIGNMARVIRSDIAAGSPAALGERARSLVNSVGFHARSFFRTNPDLPEDEFEAMDQMVRNRIQRSGLRNAQLESLAYDLAYAIGKTRKGGGRLANYDVETAIKTIQAAQADPMILLSTLNMIARNAMQNARDAAIGLTDLPMVQEVTRALDQRALEVADAFGGAGLMDFSDPDALNQFLDARLQGQAELPDTSLAPGSSSGPRIIGVRQRGQ